MKIMKKVKGTVLTFSLLGGILTASGIVHAEAAVSPNVVEQTVLSSTISPCSAIYYEKTITKYYSSISDVPESIVYSEYNNAFCYTFSGRLYLQSVVKLGTRYLATYTGTLAGSGL